MMDRPLPVSTEALPKDERCWGQEHYAHVALPPPPNGPGVYVVALPAFGQKRTLGSHVSNPVAPAQLMHFGGPDQFPPGP